MKVCNYIASYLLIGQNCYCTLKQGYDAQKIPKVFSLKPVSYLLKIPFFVCVSVLILDARQKRAEELRRLTDQSASMSEEQLTELRADIKVL